MNKQTISNMFKNAKVATIKHGPVILTGLGIAGMITTTVLAVKATPKALDLIEQKKEEEGKDELKFTETVSATWKCYIPATVLGAASIGCIIGASSVNTRRTAALATAYKLSETAFAEYKEKVVETIGEKKEKTVKDKVAKAKVEKNPVKNNEIIITGKGKTLCMDAISGRYFESNIDDVIKAINKINRSIVVDMYASLNDFYDEIGLEHIDIGDSLGWNIDRGEIEIETSAQLTPDERPCLVVSFNRMPAYNFYRMT